MKPYLNSCISINNYPYRIRESGRGIPFLWLHGMFHSLDIEDVFAVVDFSILSENFRLIRIELPAHGESPVPDDPQRLSWLAIASDINELIRKLEIESCFIGGFSQGAGIAAHVALNNPQVKGAVLAMLPNVWENRPAVRKTYNKLLKRLETENSRDIIERLFTLTKYVPNALNWQSSVAEEINAQMFRLSSHAIKSILKGAILSDMPAKEELARIKTPFLLMAWEDDNNHPMSSFYNTMEICNIYDSFVLNNQTDLHKATLRISSFIAEKC